MGSKPPKISEYFFAANHIGKFFGIPFRRGETWGTIGTGFKIGPSLGSDQTAQCFTTSKIISFPTFPFLSIFYPVCCETSNSSRKTSGMRSPRDQTSTNQMATTGQESYIGRSVKNTFLVSQILVLVQTALVRGWKFMGMRLSAFHCVWCQRPEVFRVFFSVFLGRIGGRILKQCFPFVILWNIFRQFSDSVLWCLLGHYWVSESDAKSEEFLPLMGGGGAGTMRRGSRGGSMLVL